MAVGCWRRSRRTGCCRRVGRPPQTTSGGLAPVSRWVLQKGRWFAGSCRGRGWGLGNVNNIFSNDDPEAERTCEQAVARDYAVK